MMIYRRLLFIFVISCKQTVNSRVVIYLFIVIRHLRRFQPCLFSATEIFIPDALWYEKPAPKTGARKWSRFMAPVSGACVTVIRLFAWG